MIRSLFTIFTVLLLLFHTTGRANEQMVVGDFSGQPQDGILPDFWEPLVFDNVDKHTVYTHVVDGGTGVIQAASTGGSSALIRKITIDPSRYPTLSFRWKIQNTLKSADLTKRNGDDAPARIYITFAYDSEQVGLLEAIKFEALKLFYGEYPPIAALVYVWSSHLKQGTIRASSYTSRAKIIVLESGADKKGRWVSEQRDIHADYRTAFGSEKVPMVSGVAVMTDTDNTGEQAISWYGDIIFSSSLSN